MPIWANSQLGQCQRLEVLAPPHNKSIAQNITTFKQLNLFLELALCEGHSIHSVSVCVWGVGGWTYAM